MCLLVLCARSERLDDPAANEHWLESSLPLAFPGIDLSVSADAAAEKLALNYMDDEDERWGHETADPNDEDAGADAVADNARRAHSLIASRASNMSSEIEAKELEAIIAAAGRSELLGGDSVDASGGAEANIVSVGNAQDAEIPFQPSGAGANSVSVGDAQDVEIPLQPSGDQKQPTVAFHMLGFKSSLRPAWSGDQDKVHIFAPDQTCSKCPNSAKVPPPARRKASQGWWCAQRSYMKSVAELIEKFPNEDYYMMVDGDTLVFPEYFNRLLQILENKVLKSGEDLFIGHGFGGLQKFNIPKFVMTGGGALVRGSTLRKLNSIRRNGQSLIEHCVKKQEKGWCWHHLDWVLAECLEKAGVKRQGHQAFQQLLALHPKCCGPTSVTCHPVAPKKMKDMLAQRKNLSDTSVQSVLTTVWAQPCKNYAWDLGCSSCRDSDKSKASAMLENLPAAMNVNPTATKQTLADPLDDLLDDEPREGDFHDFSANLPMNLARLNTVSGQHG